MAYLSFESFEPLNNLEVWSEKHVYLSLERIELRLKETFYMEHHRNCIIVPLGYSDCGTAFVSRIKTIKIES